MKNSLIIFMALSFIGVAVFGFLGMGSHEPGHGVNGCIAALMKETGCAGFNSPVDFAVFHLTAYKIFSSANIGAATFMSMIILVLTLLFAVFFKFSEPKLFVSPIKEIKQSKYPLSYGFRTFNELRFVHWLALHEKRSIAFLV